MNQADFSNITFPSVLNVTEQEIDISALTDEQKQFYIDLFKELVEIYQSRQKPRMIIGMTGPAGAGKSVIAAIFQEVAKQVSLPFRFETVGIDAFHYTNDFLVTNMSGGELLKNHKGRFDTYDVEKLVTTLIQFSKGEEVSLPKYSRKIHDPIENAIVIHEQNALLFVEGLWLLYGQNGWEKVGKLLDFSIFVEADKGKVKHGVVGRHMAGGRTSEDAFEYYEANEAKNFDLIMRTKSRADKIIPAYYGV